MTTTQKIRSGKYEVTNDSGRTVTIKRTRTWEDNPWDGIETADAPVWIICNFDGYRLSAGLANDGFYNSLAEATAAFANA